MKIVTAWYKQNNRTKEYEFNHLVHGREWQNKPTPLGNFPSQNDWKNYNWISEVFNMTGYKLIKLQK